MAKCKVQNGANPGKKENNMTARMFQIVSNTVRMHASEILFSFVSAVPNRFKYRHNACFRDIVFIFFLQFQIVSNIGRRQNAPFNVIVFKIFSAVPNRFKYRQDACFRDIVLIYFFFAIPNHFNYRFLLQFSVVANHIVRMHA